MNLSQQFTPAATAAAPPANHRPIRSRLLWAAALLALASGPVAAAPVTAVYGDHAGMLWTSTAGPAATQSTPVVGFTVGGTTYSTGVADSLLPAGHTPAEFRAFTPLNIGATLIGLGSTITNAPTLPTPIDLASYLTDGPRGLDLATALFNRPATQNLDFPIALTAGALASTQPAIVATQMGQPGTSDTYEFIDASGGTVGNSMTVTYTGSGIGQINWRFYTSAGGRGPTEVSLDGNRDVRMVAYTLGDFGLNAGNIGSVVAFRQRLNTQSDVAFVAYNEGLLAVSAPNMAIDLSGLNTNPLILGQPYTGSFSCTNLGNATANVSTTCTATLPAGLTQGTCTIDTTTPAPTWVPGNAVPAGAVVTCQVGGAPTAAGPTSASGSTSGSNTSTVAGTPITTADSDPSNNTANQTLTVRAPDMQVDSVDLPAAIVGQPYSGSFVCSNHGDAAATDATCAHNLPAWTSVTCTPSTTPVASLAPGAPISCTVTGTPATGDKGSTPVTITAGTGSTESDATNNTGNGTLAVTGTPAVVIDLTGLPPSGTVNQPYTGTFTCTNQGTDDAASAACTVDNLPPGLTTGACTISPSGAAWTSPSAIPEGQTVTCEVTGTPTQPGDTTANGTGGSSTGTRDITIRAAAVAPVPTLTQWGQMLMAALLAAVGLAGARRMRKA